MDKIDKRSYYRDVFNSEAGKIVLNDLMKFCHLDFSIYNNEVNVNDMIFMSGERNVGLYILNMLHRKQKEVLVDLMNELDEQMGGVW